MIGLIFALVVGVVSGEEMCRTFVMGVKTCDVSVAVLGDHACNDVVAFKHLNRTDQINAFVNANKEMLSFNKNIEYFIGIVPRSNIQYFRLKSDDDTEDLDVIANLSELVLFDSEIHAVLAENPMPELLSKKSCLRCPTQLARIAMMTISNRESHPITFNGSHFIINKQPEMCRSWVQYKHKPGMPSRRLGWVPCSQAKIAILYNHTATAASARGRRDVAPYSVAIINPNNVDQISDGFQNVTLSNATVTPMQSEDAMLKAASGDDDAIQV